MLRRGWRVVSTSIVVLCHRLNRGRAVHVVVVSQLHVSFLYGHPKVDEKDRHDEYDDAGNHADDQIDEAKPDGDAGTQTDHADDTDHLEDKVRHHKTTDLARGTDHHEKAD